MNKVLNFLERKFGKYATKNLTYYLIIGQVIGFVLFQINPQRADLFLLSGNLVLQGQLWRLLTMLFIPVSTEPIFFAFAIYLYYLYGMGLENEWGAFRYQIYFLISYLLTTLAAFVFPTQTFGNAYIYSSIFLAFAYLFPNFELLIFFVIPVKIKWLALIVWAGIFGSVIFGGFSDKILAIISIFNFLLFFGGDIFTNFYLRGRRVTYKTKDIAQLGASYMKCAICGKTEKDPKIFYNCDICIPETCYCEDHINDHEHKK